MGKKRIELEKTILCDRICRRRSKEDALGFRGHG